MPAISYGMAFGVGVTGTIPTLKADAVAEDAAGDIVVAGSFRGTVNFANGGTATNVSSTGNQDSFVAEYTSAGVLAWVDTFRGQSSTTSVSQVSALAVDGSGNIEVTGTFSGSVNFDPGTGSTILAAPSQNDVFVVKLGGTGNLIWAVSETGSTNALDEAFALAPDGSGGVYIAGSYQGSASFGILNLTATGLSDAFAAHISSSGSSVWAKSSVGTSGSNAGINSLAVDATGRLVMAGFYAGTVNFDPNGGSSLLSANGGRDALVWVLGSSGTLAWARGFGGPDFDQANALAVDPSGNIYVTGSFSDTVNFGSTASPINLTAGQVDDVFVLKLATNGTTAWAESFVGTTAASSGTGIGIDPLGRVIVSGSFGGKVQFDPTGGTASITAGGSLDAFAVGLDGSGNFLDVADAGGSASTTTVQPSGLALNASGALVTAGNYTGPSTFGTTNLATIGSSSFYVATLSQTLTPPVAPAAPSLEAASDSGRSQSDGITNVTAPTFDVTATGSSLTVQLLRDGVVVASRTGSGPLTDPGRVPDGVHQYTARQVDALGNVGPSSTSTPVTIDTNAPATAPAPALATGDDSGTPGDGITNHNQPHLVGSAAANAFVQISTTLGQSIASGLDDPTTGAYTLQATSVLADGTYTLVVTATDVAGNVSSSSLPFTLVIDTTSPAAPSAPALLAADDSGGAGLTNHNLPHLIGSAEAGATVQIFNGSTLIGTGIAVNGAYSIQPTTALADGSYTLTATATDLAGNISLASKAFVLVIDTIAPAVPSAPALLAADDSGGAGLTNHNLPHLIGSAEAGASVQIFNGSTLIGTGIATGGAYSIQPTTALADASYTLTATATDLAGNVSLASKAFALVIDTTAPAVPSAPGLLAADDSGGAGLTNHNLPHLIGSAEAGASVQIFNGSTLIGTGIAVGGAYSIQPTTALADGSYTLTATATDAAGNVSLASKAFALVIDTTAPAVPSAPALLATDDSGGAGLTNHNLPHLIGSAEAGASVQIFNGSTLIGTGIAVGGAYSIQPTTALADGSYTLTATATDLAGNVSKSSLPFALVIDTTAPSAPTNLALLSTDDSGVLGDRITNVTRPHINGNAGTGLTVTLLDSSGNLIGQAVAAAGGFSIQPTTALADGTYVLHAVATDAAGNVSAASGTYTVQILSKPPAAPTIGLLAADDTGVKGDGITMTRNPRVTGTAAAGSLVQLLNASGTVLGSATASSTGIYTITTPDASAGTYTDRVRATDVAGNVGASSAPFSVRLLDVVGDFDGDGKADVETFNAVTEEWTIRFSSTGVVHTYFFGVPNLSVPVPADYFGDGRTDLAVYVPTTGDWYIYNIATGASLHYNFGWANLDLPVPGDYDGVGRAELAVYRPNTAQWFIYNTVAGTVTVQTLGVPNLSVPVPADYDGTGKLDLAVYESSNANWIIQHANGNVSTVAFGWAGVDVPIPGDYDGDGKADIAVFRPFNSQFFIDQSSNGVTLDIAYGAPNIEEAVPLDYDGDGRADIAVFAASTKQFFILDPLTFTQVIFQAGLTTNDTPGILPLTYRLRGMTLLV